jgi:hypothetical protein
MMIPFIDLPRYFFYLCIFYFLSFSGPRFRPAIAGVTQFAGMGKSGWPDGQIMDD